MIWEAKKENVPVRITDYNGRDWYDIFWFDMTTGFGEQLVKDSNGLAKIDPITGEVLKRRIRMETPVQILPLP